jgi:regulatory protein
MLGRREHSAKQLQQKLRQRGVESEVVVNVIEDLQARGWQSDDRFGALWVGARSRKGLGRSRIEAELQQAGIAKDHAAPWLEEVDFSSLAIALRARRFGALPKTASDQAKQSRFLQYRGFGWDDIKAALKRLPADESGLDADLGVDLEPD